MKEYTALHYIFYVNLLNISFMTHWYQI